MRLEFLYKLLLDSLPAVVVLRIVPYYLTPCPIFFFSCPEVCSSSAPKCRHESALASFLSHQRPFVNNPFAYLVCWLHRLSAPTPRSWLWCQVSQTAGKRSLCPLPLCFVTLEAKRAEGVSYVWYGNYCDALRLEHVKCYDPDHLPSSFVPSSACLLFPKMRRRTKLKCNAFSGGCCLYWLPYP